MSEVKIFSNTKMVNSTFSFESFTEAPTSPTLGQTCIINGILSVFTLVNGVSFWLPLGARRSFYKHTQATPSAIWEVDHNLGSYDILVGIYDDNNVLIYADYYFLSPDKIQVRLNEEKMGRCIIFGDSNTLAGFNTPDILNQDTVSYGTEEPSNNVGTTLYFQLEETPAT
jgi:hypothetical protein